jgi:hypothetical protein
MRPSSVAVHKRRDIFRKAEHARGIDAVWHHRAAIRRHACDPAELPRTQRGHRDVFAARVRLGKNRRSPGVVGIARRDIMHPRREAHARQLIHHPPQRFGESGMEWHREHIVQKHDVLLREHRPQGRRLRIGAGILRQPHRLRTATAQAENLHAMPVLGEKSPVFLHHALDPADHRRGRVMHEGDIHGSRDALSGGMRIVSIIIVLAIVYLVYGRNGEKQSVQTRLAEAQHEAAAVQPVAQQPQPAAVTGSLRAPIDRTRQVLELVKQRN